MAGMGAWIVCAAAAFVVLTERTPEPRGVALSAVILAAGSAVIASGATAKLRGQRRDLQTLRALGWTRGEVRRLLLRQFLQLAVISSLAAALVAYLCEAVLGRAVPSRWELLAIPAAIAMTIAAAWWPVRRAAEAANPMATPCAHKSGDWIRWQPWVLGQATRNLLSAPRRTALKVLVIAASGSALGAELTMQSAFGGTLVSSWLGHAISWHEDPTDTLVVFTTLVMATVTVGELDRLSAHELEVERRTLQAVGWSACGVARLVAAEATLLGLAGGVCASVLDMSGGLVIAHRVPAGMLTATTVVAGAGLLVSLAGAAGAAMWSRHSTTAPR
jgi:putative ABC transport system permease protein